MTSKFSAYKVKSWFGAQETKQEVIEVFTRLKMIEKSTEYYQEAHVVSNQTVCGDLGNGTMHDILIRDEETLPFML